MSPKKLENRIKKNRLIKIKIVPGNTNNPNTALSSSYTNIMIFLTVLIIWESINQYIWGIKNMQILAEIQLKGRFIIKILVFGSNDEKRFVILNYNHKFVRFRVRLNFNCV